MAGFVFALLRMGFANRGLRGLHRPRGGAPSLRGKPGAPTGRPQAWECEQNRTLVPPPADVGAPGAPGRSLAGKTSVARSAAPITPPRIERRRYAATLGPRGGATDGDRDGPGGAGRNHRLLPVRQGRCLFLRAILHKKRANGHPPARYRAGHGHAWPSTRALWLHCLRLAPRRPTPTRRSDPPSAARGRGPVAGRAGGGPWRTTSVPCPWGQ